MLNITDQELQQLDRMVANMPTQYGMGLVQLFNGITARNKREQEATKLLQQKNVADTTGPDDTNGPENQSTQNLEKEAERLASESERV